MNNESDVIREPELYDLFNSRERSDIDMYLTLFSKASSVLELGIGTGRVALPLAENGITVTGVDHSAEMLQCLEKKLNSRPHDVSSKVKTIHQDFCYLDVEDKFDFAFYPLCTFNYLLTLEEQKNALNSLRKCLTSKAIVVFDLMTINTFPNMLYNNHHTGYDSVLHGDYDVNIATQSIFDQSTQLYTQDRKFDYVKKHDVVFKKRVRMINRIFFLGEFKLLLEQCGYQIDNYYGEYTFLKFSASSHSLIVVASPIS